MTPGAKQPPTVRISAEAPASFSRTPDDPRVIAAMEEYCAAVHAGQTPDRKTFLARHADVAEVLAKCIDGLAFVRKAAPQLSRFGEDKFAAAGDEVQPSAALGDFQIVREIGRGGMGIVYEAVQISLGRRVALKVLPFAAALDTKQLQRFKNEAQAAAFLQHTNIVPVYYVGCERGVHFYAMQYIDGRTLAQVIADLRLQNADLPKARHAHDARTSSPATQQERPAADSAICDLQSVITPTPPVAALSTEGSAKSPAFFRTVAQLGLQAAEALEHAHQTGIIHRDIKPANLLLDAGGRLWVADFGLAHCQSQPGLTRTGDVLGTLRYISPEQALAKRGAVDARTDVYSLGVTLYELLTLEPAYKGRDRAELLQQIAFEEPTRPRRLNPAVPAELETITLKAMAKQPKERYASAEELADDLRRFLAGEPIRARRVRAWERARKWARRRPAAAALIAVSVVAFLSILGGTLWHNAQLSAALYDSLVTEAQAIRKARESGYRGQVFVRLKHAMQLTTPKKNLLDLRQEAALCLGDFVGLEPTSWDDFPEVIWSAALRPDGALLAVGLDDGMVLLRRMPDGARIDQLTGHRSAIANLAFRADGNELVSTDWRGVVKLWQVQATGRWTCTKTFLVQRTLTLVTPSLAFPFFLTTSLSWSSPFPRPHLTAATLTPCGQYLVASWVDATVTLVDLARGRISRQFAVPNGEQVEALAVSPDGKLLAGGYVHQGVHGILLWDVQTCTLQKRLLPRLEQIYCLRFSPDNKLLVCTCTEGIALYDTGTLQPRAFECGNFPLGVAFSPDSQILAYHSINHNSIRLWDLGRSRQIAALNCEGPLFWMEFSKDGRTLVAAGRTGVNRKAVYTWNLAGASEKQVLQGHAVAISGVVFSPDGRLLATCGRDHKVKVWDPLTGRLLKELEEFSTAVEGPSFSPDGRILAAGNYEQGKVVFYEVESWKPMAVLQPRVGSRVSSTAFSVDGQSFAAAGSNGLTLWRVVRDGRTISFQLLRRLSEEFSASICFSQDCHWLAWVHANWGREKHRVRVWDLICSRPHAESIARIRYGMLIPNVLGFSPDRNRLVFISEESTLTAWDMITKKEHTLSGEGLLDRSGVKSPSTHLSADGTWYAMGDQAVAVWDLKAKKLLVTLSPGNRVRCVGWSPNRELLAVGNYDGGLEIWNLPEINAKLAEIGLGW